MRVRDTLREMTPMGAPKTETPIGAVDPDTLGPHLAMSEGGAGPKGTPGGGRADGRSRRQPPRTGKPSLRPGYQMECTASSAGKCAKAPTPQVRRSRYVFEGSTSAWRRSTAGSQSFLACSGKHRDACLPSGPVSLSLVCEGGIPRRTGAGPPLPGSRSRPGTVVHPPVTCI